MGDQTRRDTGGGQGTPERLTAGRLTLDQSDETVTLAGTPLNLRGKPFRLLELLMTQAPSLVTKQEIIGRVWDGMSVSDAVMTTAIREVRIALGDDARAPRWIKTAHGRGYRFIVPVLPAELDTELRPGPSPAAHTRADTPAKHAGSKLKSPRQARADGFGPDPRLRLVLAGVIGTALLVLAAGVAATMAMRGDAPSPLDSSVAVLGFETLSDNDEAHWFSDGLSEEITAALGRLPDIRVASRRATLPFDGDDETGLAAIGQALNVAHIVDGSVRLEGERVRVTVHLVEAQSGLQRWSETYDRDFADILDLQGDIAVEVARVLDTALDAEALDAMVAAGTDSIAAYEAYLRAQSAMAEFSRTGNARDWGAALPLLDRARTIDPGFAEAHALSALVFRYLNTPSLVMGPDPLIGEAYRQAYSERMNAAVAAARDTVQAAVYRGRRDQELFDLDEARAAYETYLEARPLDIDRWFDYSNTLVMMGRHDEAGDVVSELNTLIPAADLQSRGLLIQHARKARRFDLAVAIGRQALQVDPYHGFSLIETQIAMHYAGLHQDAATVAARIQESELGRYAKLFSEIYRVCAAGDGAQARELGRIFLEEPRAVIQGYGMLRLSGREDAAYARLAPLDAPGVPGRLRELLFDPSFDARRFPHLAAAIRDAGGELTEPEPYLVLCPDRA